MSARSHAIALVLLAGCGTSSAGIDAGTSDDAATPSDGASDAAGDAGAIECPEFPPEGRRRVDLAVSLANFETGLLRAEAATVSGSGTACIARHSDVQTIAVFDELPGSVYEVRFTAEGYVPYTYRYAVGGVVDALPVVMVRGTVLGPALPSTLPLETVVEPSFGTRPGTDDLFFVLGDTWRVARAAAGGRTISTIDVSAPVESGLSAVPAFTPDGDIALLVTTPPTGSYFSCVAVRAATGEVLERDLPRTWCAVGAHPIWAASADVGLVSDESTGENVLFEWDAAGLHERRRFAFAAYEIDATGAHVLHEDGFGNPLILDVATGTDAMPPRQPDDFSRQNVRMLGADGTFTLHATGMSGYLRSGGHCGTGGCDVMIEPVGGTIRSVVTGAQVFRMSARLPALVYVSASGELHHHVVTPSTDTVVAVDPFDPTMSFGYEDALGLVGPSGLQIVDAATGEVRVALSGALVPDIDARVGWGGERTMIARTCYELDCESWLVDLHAMSATRTHDHPFRGGERAWYRDAAGLLGAGPSTDATGRFVLFAGEGSTMSDVAIRPAGALLPCAPFLWRDLWVCAE